MMKKLLSALLCALLVLGLASNAMAVTITHNDNVTAIFGTGNPPQGWTTATSDNGQVELSLRGKNRTDGTTPNNGAGTFYFDTGTAPSSTRAKWNMEWSISLFGAALGDFTYMLMLDIDPSTGTNYITVDPLSYYLDNSYGTASTPMGGGVEFPTSLTGFTVAQNSTNITFAPSLLNPNLDATYSYQLAAFQNGNEVARSSITVVVGEGGAQSVPDGGSTLGMLALGLIGMMHGRKYVTS